MEKYSDKDDRAYQDAPGDKEARKKPMPQSVHTKKYHAMYGEDVNESLWANIHAKRKRIKAGSGERMRKPGEKGAPTAAGLKSASEAVEDAAGNKIADTARHGKVRYAGVRTADHKETSTQERQEVQYMKRHRMHTKRETDVDPQQIRIAQDQIKKKVIDESNNKSNEDTPAKREFGTKSLVKKYQKETPGQQKADINEIFNTSFDEEIERRRDFKMVKVRTPKGYVWRKVRREVDIERDAE